MNQSIPLVSIGMPVLNGEEFIALSLAALLDQSYPDFELVISDNASTDGTQEICQEAARNDDRITYLRSEDRLGFADNWDRAFRLTQGELFMWAPDDDLWDVDFLKILVQALSRDPEAGFAIGRYATIGVSGEIMEDDPCRYEDYFYFRHPYPRLLGFLATEFGGKSNCIHGLLRRTALEATGGFRTWDRLAGLQGDFLGAFRLLCGSHCAYDDTLIFYKRWDTRLRQPLPLTRHWSAQRDIVSSNFRYPRALERDILGLSALSTWQKRDLIGLARWKGRQLHLRYARSTAVGLSRRLRRWSAS